MDCRHKAQELAETLRPLHQQLGLPAHDPYIAYILRSTDRKRCTDRWGGDMRSADRWGELMGLGMSVGVNVSASFVGLNSN